MADSIYAHEKPGRTKTNCDETTDLVALEAALNVTLPEEAIVFYSEFDHGFPDGYGHLGVKLPRSSLQAFLDNSPFSNEKLSTTKRRIHDYDVDSDRWTPDSVQNFRSGKVARPGEVFRVLIGLDDVDTAVIYLVWFEL